MILVVGGTGRLGKEVVRRLVARGEKVRIFARNAVANGVEAVAGDVRDPLAVARAMEGVHTVVSAMHGFMADPRGIDHEGNSNLVRAAEDAKVESFVLVSVHGAAVDHPIELFHMKHLAEAALEKSRLAWSVLRPTAFMETWIEILAAPLLEGKKAVVFGRGKNPINFVSAIDVARFVDLAVSDETLRGRIVEIGGPEDLTFCDLVARFQDVMKIEGETKHVPLPMMRVMAWLMRGLHPSFARQARAGVVMDTTSMAFAAPQDPRTMTTLAEMIRRDYVK